MRLRRWNSQQKLKHFFSPPNKIFLLGLIHGELAVYRYPKYLENRKAYQCWPGYWSTGKAVGMSESTVRRYVAILKTRGLITAAYTTMRARDGRPMNEHLMYTVCPFHEMVNDHCHVQTEVLELQAQQKNVAALASQREVPAQ